MLKLCILLASHERDNKKILMSSPARAQGYDDTPAQQVAGLAARAIGTHWQPQWQAEPQARPD